jgi:hypothetical protein
MQAASLLKTNARVIVKPPCVKMLAVVASHIVKPVVAKLRITSVNSNVLN